MQKYNAGDRVGLVNADRNATIVAAVINPEFAEEFVQAQKRYEEEYGCVFNRGRESGEIYLIRDDEGQKVFPAYESELGEVFPESN
jgi:hypothetical protein